MITSVKNERVKAWKKLQKRKERNHTGTFLVEGHHLVEEANSSSWSIKEIIAEQSVPLPEWCRDFPVELVSDNVFEHISQTRAPQGIAAVVEMNKEPVHYGGRLLLIDAIQDPGNLGTIIRTADAAGMDGIILGEGTVDLYNDKVIRATQGSIFHIPIAESSLREEITELKENGFIIWATALEGAVDYQVAEPAGNIAIIMGNEGAGVKQEFIDKADRIVKIPIYGKAESLNVSIAAGILMYHLRR